MISLRVSLVINPWPSLSYSLTILIKFFKNALNFLISKRSKKLSDDLSQSIISNKPLALSIIKFERILQLLLHFFQRRVLNQESCTKLAKLSKFNFTRSIFINLLEQVSKLFLCWPESHSSHDLSKIISREKLLLLSIKQVKANLETLNLISSKVGQLIDLLKINISVWISPTHGKTY